MLFNDFMLSILPDWSNVYIGADINISIDLMISFHDARLEDGSDINLSNPPVIDNTRPLIVCIANVSISSSLSVPGCTMTVSVEASYVMAAIGAMSDDGIIWIKRECR